MAGGLIFVGPEGRRPPDQTGAPGMVAHHDDGGGIPLPALAEQLADMGEVAVGEGEIIDIRGAVGGELSGAAVIDSAWMGGGDVEQQEASAVVVQHLVGVRGELLVIGDVQPSRVDREPIIPVIVGHEPRREAKPWSEGVGADRSPSKHPPVVVLTVGPSAAVEYRREDSAVGDVPAGDRGGVAFIQLILTLTGL